NKKMAILPLLCTLAFAAYAQDYSVLASFNGSSGKYPMEALTQGTDGNLYGTTPNGGTALAGTVFRITRAGKLTAIYNFCSQASCSDGYQPEANLVLGANGHLYGTTYGGGLVGGCGGPGCGTVFEITSSGKLTTIYRFCNLLNCADGIAPHA